MTPNDHIIEPKQARSKETQKKLLTALHQCLEEKFFEHISIQELATKANVSVGSYYRRFKNKESLLPLLYADFGNDLQGWVTQFEANTFNSLEQTIDELVHQTVSFLAGRISVFRTLHLNSRLHPEMLTESEIDARRDVYNRLADTILRYEADITCEDKRAAAEMVVHTVINGCMDKMLYPTHTPAIASRLKITPFADQLAAMQLAYLTA